MRVTLTVHPSNVADTAILMELHRLGAFGSNAPEYHEIFGVQGAYTVSVDGDHARYLLALMEEGARAQSLSSWVEQKANPAQLSLPGSTA